MKSILLVEDNDSLQAFNKQMLEDEGFEVALAMTLSEARQAVSRKMPDIILLDILLPDGNGLDFLRSLREYSSVQVIALTNNAAEQDIVTGLRSGCDDYIPKPYTFDVLLARIEARLRAASQLPDAITRGNLKLTFLPKVVLVDGQDIKIAGREFDLLLLLVKNAYRTLSYDYLYENVWGQPLANDVRALAKNISVIRKKLETARCSYTIAGYRNKGYCFEPA